VAAEHRGAQSPAEILAPVELLCHWRGSGHALTPYSFCDDFARWCATSGSYACAIAHACQAASITRASLRGSVQGPDAQPMLLQLLAQVVEERKKSRRFEIPIRPCASRVGPVHHG
jgi:hypothetical protein